MNILFPGACSTWGVDAQILQDSMKKKELKPVEHSKISYIDVRKNLYIIPKALATLSDDEVRWGAIRV